MDEIEARVREMIRASDIPAEVAVALQDSLRYSIRMHTALASDDELALGATKIGGQPDLPPGHTVAGVARRAAQLPRADSTRGYCRI